MDRSRADRNQELINVVRAGQTARVDLSIYEEGFAGSMLLAQFIREVVQSDYSVLIDADAPTLSLIGAQADAMGLRVLQLRDIELRAIEESLSDRSLLCVADNGFRKVCRNMECVSRWGVGPDLPLDYLGEAANVLRTKEFIRRRRCSFTSLISSGERARACLVDENLGLIRKVANAACRDAPSRFDDMFSVASLQFVHCMDVSYDARRDTLFTTYAQRCMADRCKQEGASPSGPVHIPHGMHTVANALTSGELDPDASEILDPDKRSQAAAVRRNLIATVRPMSLDAKAGEDDTRVLYDVIPDEDGDIDRMLAEVTVREAMRKVYERLAPKVRVVMEGRVAVGDGEDPKSLDRIAAELLDLGLVEHAFSRQRVGQIWEVGRDFTITNFDEEYLRELGIVR